MPRPLALRRSLGRAAPANILAPFATDGLYVHVRGHVYSALHYAWVLSMDSETLFSLFPGKKSAVEGAGGRVCERVRGRYRFHDRDRGWDGRVFDPLGLFLCGQLVGAVLLSSAYGFGLESLYGVLGAEFVLGACSRLAYREVRPEVVVEALDRVLPPRLCARLGRRPAAAHGWLHDNVRDVSYRVSASSPQKATIKRTRRVLVFSCEKDEGGGKEDRGESDDNGEERDGGKVGRFSWM